MLIGVVGDAVFGPVVACGAGGVEAEMLKDVAVRLSPLTALDAREMLRSLATFPLLTGYRGAPEVDLPRWRSCSCGSARWSRPIMRSPSWT